MNKTDIEVFLYKAVHSEFGIELKTTNREIIKRKFYSFIHEARKQGNTAFDCLAIKRSGEDDSALFLIKKDKLKNVET